MVFAANNLVTDSLLLYRCFVIWGSDWRRVVFPGILMTCTFVIECVNNLVGVEPATMPRLPYVFAALINLVLVVLIGCRTSDKTLDWLPETGCGNDMIQSL
ncbi:hypothetical protein B0H16DRAFT_718619 [Mycena metata]|uniref:Uncharacterized protein n=1 Tax=Mycena metata TaxID=1033252 RepID=A0AAD7GSB3_9AGAR|nr:hypothetical protein B0H16DRAFT_718619 [Mycena metata]